MAEPPRYLAYLLRLWQVGGEGEPAWRASLESASSGERHGFASPEALFAFLEERMRAESAGPPPVPFSGYGGGR
jgi:hypothetical protein